MINVSNDFKERMKESRTFKSYAEITFPDGKALTLDSSQFTVGNNNLVDGAGISSFPIGVAVQKNIQIEILNDAEQYKDYDFVGAKIRNYLDFRLNNGTTERIEKGTYTVVSPETYGETVIITAYDDMYKADQDYSTKLTFPQTAGSLLRDICSTCDITLGSTTFLHDDFIIQNKPAGKFREIIGYIAMIACGNARIDVRNRLQIIPYDFTGFETEENYHVLSEWQAPKIEYNDSVITGFKTVIKGDTSEEDVEVIAGTNDYLITVQNPLISGREESVLSWLLERIGNVPFRPFSGDLVSNPLIEFMDLAKVQDRRGRLYNSFITDVNFLLPGYTTVKNSSPSQEKSAMSYASDASKVEIRVRKLVNQEKTDRELAISKLNQALEESSGMYSTEEVQPDGSTIYYLHNKSTIAESKNVMKLTAEAIGFSVDGGNTYPYGFTIDGEMIMRIIQTEGLNADWITSGAFTVKDDNGNIIFSADKDTKNVIISGDHVQIGGKTATAAINDVLKESKDYSDGKLADYANTVTDNITNLQSQIDGAIETYFYDYEPTLQNIPASQWTTTAEREKHEGDLFYWKSKGYAYRFFKDGATWKWQLVKDTDITQAMAAAEKAQDTADGKRRVFVVTPQPPYDIGDLWVNGSDILTCAVARAQGSAYVSSDWKKMNKYTDDTVANQALEEAKKARNFNIILDNEYQGIPADYQGNISTFPSVKTTVQTFYGQTDVSASCTYTVQKSEGVTGTWNGAARTYTVTALMTDTGWVDIAASYLNLFTTTKRFNVAKVKGGNPGEQGTQGINLLPSTKTMSGYSKSSTVTISVDNNGFTVASFQAVDTLAWRNVETRKPIPFSTIRGKTVTVSLWVKSDDWEEINAESDRGLQIVGALCTATSSARTLFGNLKKAYAIQLSDQWQKVTSTVTLTDDFFSNGTGTIADDTRFYLQVYNYSLHRMDVKQFKLELGTVNNPVWTPAIEDLQGPPGKDGAAGRTYFIESSSNILKRSADNTISPNFVEFNAYYRDGNSASRTAYLGRFKIEESTDGETWTTMYTSTADESSIYHSLYSAISTAAGSALATADGKMIGIPRDVILLRCTLYAAGGTTNVLDMQSITVVTDVDALTHEEIFNLLTNNGEVKGFYEEGNQLYISFTYAKGGILKLGGTDGTYGELNVYSSSRKQIIGMGYDGFVDWGEGWNDGVGGRCWIKDGIIRLDYKQTTPYEIYTRATLWGGQLDLTDSNTGEYYFWINAEGLKVAGKKSRIANSENYNKRLLYCYEMSSPMFGDIGEGQTDEDGECYIYLDDIFSETITANIEYQVFLQKEGPGDVWIAEKNPTYFVVKGTENLKFSWEIKAKQRDYEYERLESFEGEEEPQEIDYETEYLQEINQLIREQEEILYATT